jgi:hypothetical protein
MKLCISCQRRRSDAHYKHNTERVTLHEFCLKCCYNRIDNIVGGDEEYSLIYAKRVRIVNYFYGLT